jgi:chromatin-remodeling ATPase INO80
MEETLCWHSTMAFGSIKPNNLSPYTIRADGLPRLYDAKVSALAKSCLSRPMMQWYIPPAIAPPVEMRFLDGGQFKLPPSYPHLDDTLALYGLPPSLIEDPSSAEAYEEAFCMHSSAGILDLSPRNQTSTSFMQVPDGKRLIYDSAKLARLDLLLQELKAGDHKVLIYFQMTKMMDLMEEYLIYRQHKYLRLDGSSKLEDRRDMVMDWQTR